MNMLWWIFCGAAGLWIGMPNPVASFPAAALLYPASLFLLGTGSTSWKHAFRLGWLCGLAGASACLYWLAIPVHDFGGLPWALAAPCPLLMGAYIGLYGGLFAALAHALRGEPAWRKGVALGLGWYLTGMLPGLVLHRFPLDYAGLGLHAVDARHPAGLGDRCVWARRPAGWLVLPLCGRDSPCAAPSCASEALASGPWRFPCRYLSGCCLRRVFPLFCAFRPRRAVGILGAGQP